MSVIADRMAEEDFDIMDDIKDGLAVADDALDLLIKGEEFLDPDDPPEVLDIVMPPPKETPPAVLENEKIYGVAGALALVQSPDGWSVDVLGRRISPLLFLGALGALWAAYKLMSPAPRRRRRR